jgi:HAE1 family hydrophobic/amphiphilic exporter-1
MAIRTAFFGDDTLVFRERGEEYPMIVEFNRDRRTIDSFNELLISTSRGMVPVADLGRIEFRQASRNIYRVDRNRMTEIFVNLGKSTIGPVRGLIRDEIRQMDIPEGVRIIFGGATEMQEETSNEMMSTFILATILTLMLLAAIMNSIGHSIKISASIFSSFAGVFIFLFLTGATMNISAMMAIIMLVGLAVNTEILLIEPAVKDIEKGRPPVDALWDQYKDKFRMVLMTTIAVITGLIPQLFSPNGSRVSMAAVLIGGLLGGLVFTFTLTPALFIAVENMRDRMFGIDRGNKIGRVAWLWMRITGIGREQIKGMPYPWGRIGRWIKKELRVES